MLKKNFRSALNELFYPEVKSIKEKASSKKAAADKPMTRSAVENVFSVLIFFSVFTFISVLMFYNSGISYESDYDTVNGKYGFTSIFNIVRIPYEYEKIAFENGGDDDFSDGICWVKKDGLWGAINKRNKAVVPFEYETESGSLWTEKLYELTRNGKHGVISEDGEITVPFEYDTELYFDENNITMAVKDGKVGCIDRDNKTVIPFDYGLCGYYNNLVYAYQEKGIMLLKKDGKIGAINKKGEVIVPFEYEVASFESSYDGETYVLTDSASFCDYGLVILGKNGKQGVLNLNNEIVIPFEYDEIFPTYSTETFSAWKGNKGYDFDFEGNLIEAW